MSRNCQNNNKKTSSVRLSRIAQLVILSIALSQAASAKENEEVVFNSAFMRSAIDVGAYSQGNPIASGTHTVDIYVNDKWKGRTDVNFTYDEENPIVAKPCFNINLVSMLGMNIDKLTSEILQKLQSANACLRAKDIVPDLSAEYDIGTQRINIQAPQIYLLRHARGYVSPELWDHGIPAATLQYDYNAYHSSMSGGDSLETQYLGLRGGINWDAWRLRYRGSFNWNKDQGWQYDNTNTYLERAIIPLRSRLVIGESSTDGNVFDSVGFRGVMLSSDDRMYMDSQRGFAPVVNGIANTNALIQVSQRGTRIYETTVPPGPFTLDDLYPTGVGGDLLVTIKEADGSERRFTVTYASIAELLRPGTTRYTLMGGRYHNASVDEKPDIMQGTLRHGFSNLITGYTGILGGENYQSVAGGVALNTSAGAISTDITHARSTLRDDIKREGQSLRFSFAKILPVVNTNVTLASYRYSSSGYYGIDDAMRLRAGQLRDSSWFNDTANRKNRVQLSATQDIDDSWGSFNISISSQDYWNRSGRDTEYQFGYTNVFKRFNLNINGSRTWDLMKDKWDNKIAIGISLPLGDSGRSAYLNSTYIQERDHRGIQNSLAGTAGDNRQYSYSAFGSVDRYKDVGTRTTGGLSGNWTSPWSNIGGSMSAGKGYQQYGVSLSGGGVAWQSGVALTPVMGDTMAVIEADHAAGAQITNNNSLRLNSSGKAAVPYLTPYRQNTIGLDPKGLSNDISLEVTSLNSVPTAGAVVLMKYKTDVGHSALLTLRHPSTELPFGASVLDEANNTVGYVTQGGQAFVRVKNENGQLHVRWGSGGNQRCSFSYRLPSGKSTPAGELPQLNAVCQ